MQAAASSPNPNRWKQIEDVFQEASQLDADSRAAYLDQACGSDFELRREVESLIAGLDHSDPFLSDALEQAARSYLDLAEGTVLGQYRVLRKIGSGGMGEVYLAEDTKLKRKVALKFLPQPLTHDPVALKRFEHEAQTLCALNHPNILTVFDFCHLDDRYFLVTEFVEGETLRAMLKDQGLEHARSLEIVSQICAALSAAHASGVIHRDIKPENVMVRPDGTVKVLDFGVAKLAERAREPDEDSRTVTGLLIGTPRYMSPEQIRGAAVDARTDVFSLGVLMYEMLAGKPAFRGDTQSDLVADVLRTDPPPLPRKELQAVVSKAMAKDRESRYRRVDDLLVDLRRAWRQSELRQPRLAYALAIAVVAALLSIGFLLLKDRLLGHANSTPRSLAVLPFRNLHPGPDTDFLGYSLADQVIAKLGYVKALTVRPASAVNRFRAGVADLDRAANDLKADMLLTGTYLKDGDNLQISARLIGFNPQSVLWQNTLNVKYGDLLTVQNSVSQAIIQGLELRLGPDEQARLKPAVPVNRLAYEYYLRGVDLYAISDFSAAIGMLEKSVALDANYAPTWAHLGRAYTTNASLQFGGREDYRRAESAYEKAMSLDPVSPEPRVYLANLLTDTGRVEEAIPLLRTALQSSPNNAEAHWELGYAYRYGGMLAESKEECELARRLDPEVKINSSALNAYLYLGEYQKFLSSLPSNDSPLLVFYRGLASYYLGDLNTAKTEFDRAYELAPGLLQAQIGESLNDGLKGKPNEGLALLQETERKLTERGVADPEGLYKVAQAYALLGDKAGAIRNLQRTVVGGFFCYAYIAQDPLLASLRDQPGFGAILQQARERNGQFVRRFGGGAK